jgi:hypothetical protein
MERERIEELLRVVPGRLIEQARPGLAQEIKDRIPHRLSFHRMDTINIIVDLRISRIAAAAVILLAVLLIGGVFGGRDTLGHDSKLLLKYTLSGDKACNAQVLAGLQKFRDDLIAQGKEVVYYGDRIDLDDPYAVLMHWTISEDRYGVILGDLSARTVSARTLIRLQARMVRDRSK